MSTAKNFFHFFNEKGELINLYENTLSIAIACGDNKVSAISGALRTKIINTLITDEYTARKILEYI